MPGKPLPTKLKVLRGNPGRRPLNKNEPQPQNDMPTCPSDLDAGAKKIWEREAPTLNRLGLLTEIDGNVFASACQVDYRLSQIRRELRKKGQSFVQIKHTVDGAGNEHIEVKKNPYIMMEQEYLKLQKSLWSEFGKTPRARAQTQTIGKEPDELDKFLLRSNEAKEKPKSKATA